MFFNFITSFFYSSSSPTAVVPITEEKNEDDFVFTQISISNDDLKKITLNKCEKPQTIIKKDPLLNMIQNVKLKPTEEKQKDEKKFEPHHPVLKELLRRTEKI